jgi:hypothetical protein
MRPLTWALKDVDPVAQALVFDKKKYLDTNKI